MPLRSLTVALTIAIAPGVAVAGQTPPTAPAPPAAADPDPTIADEGEDGPDIVVRGSRALPGAVRGDIPADQQLGPADIRSYGVSSVSDLLNELSPQTRSGRGGAPVVLLNGRRIGSFAEIRDLPTEAIQRVDILPEEVALKYGFRADQRVVNFVLRPRFRAVTAEIEGRAATDGGRATPGGKLDLLRITRTGRITVHLDYSESAALTEAERNIALAPSLFASPGNIVGATGGEIDPLLSARAGSPVTVAGIPAGAKTPTIGDFVATAGRPNVTDPRPFRTLLPAARSFSANGIYSTTVFGDIGATFNARIEASDTRARQGLPTIALALPTGNPFSPFSRPVTIDRVVDGTDGLGQSTGTIAAHLGATFNGTIGTWQWSLIGTLDRTDTETLTDTGFDASALQGRINAGDRTANPFAPVAATSLSALAGNRAFSRSTVGGIDALANGSLFTMPAGPVAVSVRVGGQSIAFDADSTRFGVTQSARLSRDIANGQVNVDVPLTSRSKDVLAAVGNLSANFNLAYDHFSDFGTLRTLGYGLNWSPIEAIRLIGSVTEQDGAPTPQQLGNPVVTTLNVRTFDYVLGRNATVTTLSGGNPALVGNFRRVERLGLTLKPFSKTDLSFTASYVDTQVDNPIANFPSPTAAIQAAFPGRFTRDASGELQRIDARPINFAQTSSAELRYGFNLSLPLKSTLQRQIEAFRAGTGPNPFEGLFPPGGRRGGGEGRGRGPDAVGGSGGGGASDGARRPGGGGGFGGGRGGFGGGRGGAGGRLQFALYHTWHLRDQVLVAAGGPRLDLLNGDTVGQGGGQPRHEIEAQAGYTNNGLGARLSANWQSGTRVVGGAAAGPGAQTLNFGDLATVNLRLFADLSQRLDFVKKNRWARGMRVVLSVDNLFNARQRATDAAGVTPTAYQPAYLDPLGRTIRLSIRKLFF